MPARGIQAQVARLQLPRKQVPRQGNQQEQGVHYPHAWAGQSTETAADSARVRSRSRAKSEGASARTRQRAPQHDTHYDESMDKTYWNTQNRTYLVDQLRKRFYKAKQDNTKAPRIYNLTQLNKMKKDDLKKTMDDWIDDNKPK